MIIDDLDATLLRTWIIKRLEALSADVDEDVLADYVIALLRTDASDDQVRQDAYANLADFLHNDTKRFVDDVFDALEKKSFVPGYVVPPPASAPIATSSAVSAAAAALSPSQRRSNGAIQPFPAPHQFQAQEQSRKRAREDEMDYTSTSMQGNGYGRGERQVKQMRRGRGGRAGPSMQNGTGRSNGNGMPNYGFAGSSLPSVPVDNLLNIDPNDPFAAFAAFQAMGMPNLLDLAIPPTGDVISDKPRCKDYDTIGVCARGNACPFAHGTDHVTIPGSAEDYDPRNPSQLGFKQRGRGRGRGLSSGLRGGRGRGDANGTASGGRRGQRADISQAGPNHDRSITTIVVEQIPPEQFTDSAIRAFFSEFGTIAEVTLQPWKNLALIKYKDYPSARKAYESPKVIFDNRFVKVYWHKSTNSTQANPPTTEAGTAGESSKKEETEPAFDREEFQRRAEAAQKKLEEKKAQREEMESKRAALELQKEELAQRQAEERRRLMEKLGANVNRSQNDMIMTGPDSSTMPDHGVGDLPANVAATNKESASTLALKAKLAELEAEAQSLGIDQSVANTGGTSETAWAPRGRGRGRGGRGGSYRGWEGFATGPSRGRGRGSWRGQAGRYNLDLRTKNVTVTGPSEWTGEKDEALRQYLLGVGEFSAIDSHPNQEHAQIIHFKDRPTAETFFYGSKDLPGVGVIEVSWFNAPPSSASTAPATTKPGEVMNEAQNDAAAAGTEAGGTNGSAAMEVDYDVAEDDGGDRWG